MSQIEQKFRNFLSRHPEIEKSYSMGIINRRALARLLIRNGIAEQRELQAVTAMLRRYDFSEPSEINEEIFRDIRTSIKDKIVIMTFGKDVRVLENIQEIVADTDFSSAQTLKLIIGTSDVTIIADMDRKEDIAATIVSEPILIKENISELSLIFGKKATSSKGIISAISNQLSMNDIVVSEFLTSNAELLLYIENRYSVKAYDLIKRLGSLV